ncbi:hypothetical protein JOC76_002258 [Neobacillus cucumis]|nr:hypothetical protein [Neobacillus cucumis]
MKKGKFLVVVERRDNRQRGGQPVGTTLNQMMAGTLFI